MSITLSKNSAVRNTNQVFQITPVDGALGAEITGIDLSKELSEDDFKRIHNAHLKYHLLIFKKQTLSPEQQVKISSKFGKLQLHVLKQFALPDNPEVLIVSNIKENGEPIGLGDAGHFWHSDISYVEKPSLGSFLYAQILPKEGGDTLFANQHKAYDELPNEIKDQIQGLQAEHSYTTKYEELRTRSPWRPKLTEEQLDQVKPVNHPVVRTHPESGKKALFVSEHFTSKIIGVSEDESKKILEMLFKHSTQKKYIYRHKWEENDLIFWDNRSLTHLAAGTPDEFPRKLHRTTIEGDKPY